MPPPPLPLRVILQAELTTILKAEIASASQASVLSLSSQLSPARLLSGEPCPALQSQAESSVLSDHQANLCTVP